MLLAPVEGQGSIRPPVVFIWTAADSATLYRVQVGPDSTGTMEADYDATVVDTTVRVILPHGRHFFWRVAGITEQGDTLASGWQSFATAHVSAGAPLPVAPLDGSTRQSIRPRLVWSGIPGAAAYVVQVAEDSTFLSPLVSDSSLVDTSWTAIAPFQNLSRYVWRVGAISPDGRTTYSDPWVFTTTAVPSFTVERLGFVATARGDTSRVWLVLRNPIDIPLFLDSVNTGAKVFAVERAFPDSIGGGDSLRIAARFTPDTFSAWTGALVLYTDQGAARAELRGDSPPPVLHLSRRAIKLGPVAVTETAVDTVFIKNLGKVNSLTVDALSLSSPAFFHTQPPVVHVPPGDSVAVDVRFLARRVAADAYGTHLDTLHVWSDGGRGRVTIVGKSPAPEIIVRPFRPALAEAATLDSAFVQLSITDSSVNVLRIDSILTRTSSFRPAVKRARLGNADTLWLPIRFFPERSGAFADTLKIYSNASVRMVKVPISGYSPYPDIGVDQPNVEFSPVRQGAAGKTILTIANSSISFLRIDSVKTASKWFSLEAAPVGSIVRIGSPLRISVTFKPDSIRRYADTLYIANNSRSPLLKIPLRGEATAPETQMSRPLPGQFELLQNFPNPFNGYTTIKYALPEQAYVRLEVFDLLGGKVATLFDGEQEAGYHEARWQAEVTSGMYFYRLQAGRYVATRKLLLLR